MAKKQKAEIKIEDGFYIQNLQANKIYQYNKNENVSYDTTKINRKYLYIGSLSFSLDVIKLYDICPKEFYIENKKQYSDVIINVEFDYDLNGESTKTKKEYIKDEIVDKKVRGTKLKSKDNLRLYLYENGFTVNDCKYVMYKRTASKARQGSALFIKEKYFSEMQRWSHLNIDFGKDEPVELASLKSYAALSLSSLEDVLIINPDQILMIDDQKSTCQKLFSVTELVDGELVTKTKIDTIENILHDGMSLIDDSILPDNGKCMFLLRQRWFKSAGFRCDLQSYFKDKGITEVDDKYRGCKMDVKNIKMITTPSSLKLYNFRNKIEKDFKETFFEYWIKNIDNTFGVCKNEKPSHFDEKQRLSYQIINTLPLSPVDVEELAADELKYISWLKNELAVFLRHTSLYKPLETHTLLQNLVSVNPEAERTKEFKSYRQHTISKYVEDLRQGHIKIAGSDYAVMCGNPIEMLSATCGETDIKPLHIGYEVYCPKFPDGTEIALFRSPHICSGNVLVCKNKYHEEFKYLKMTDNIVICNGFNTDAAERASGADYDSDQILCTSNPLIVKRSKECAIYPTPIKKIPLEKAYRKNNAEESAKIDIICQQSQKNIGCVVNWSQILNSYFFEEYNTIRDEGKLQFIYNNISLLSSMSQLELDRVKKYFDKININAILKKMPDLQYKGQPINTLGDRLQAKEIDDGIEIKISKKKDALKNELAKANGDKSKIKIAKDTYKKAIEDTLFDKVEKPVRPYFFKYLPDADKNYTFKRFLTPMDYLQDILETKIEKANPIKGINLVDLLVSGDAESADRGKVNQILGILEELHELRNAINANKTIEKRDKNELRQNANDMTIAEISKLAINEKTMLRILNRIVDGKYIKNYRDKNDISSFKIISLSILNKAKSETMLNCFQEIKTKTPHLVKVDKITEILLWGIYYEVVYK